MSRELTKRYVEEMLEVTGVKRNGIDRISDLLKMSDQQAESLVDDLADRARSHYRNNLPSIVESIRKGRRGPNACFLGLSPISPGSDVPDEFIRKASLYYDKIITLDRLEELLALKPAWTPKRLKENLANDLMCLHVVWPWVAEGVVEIIPSVCLPDNLQDKLYSYGQEDLQDLTFWRPQVLKDEDLGLQDEPLLKNIEIYLREGFSSDFIEKSGGMRETALRALAFGLSADVGQCFFHSCLTNSYPSTDRKRDWRLLGCWLLRRGEPTLRQEIGRDRWERLVRETKAGRTWLTLDIQKLGVLSKASPERIVEIRDSADYSLQYLREDLGNAVQEIQGLKLEDEKAYREAATQMWTKVREDARRVRRDLDVIRRKRDFAVDMSFISIILGLLPSPLAKMTAGVIGGVKGFDIISGFLEEQGMKKSTGYFLVKLDESAQTIGTPSQQST